MDLSCQNLFFVNTSVYVLQLPVFLAFFNNRVWWGAYNQAVAPGITRPLHAPVLKWLHNFFEKRWLLCRLLEKPGMLRNASLNVVAP